MPTIDVSDSVWAYLQEHAQAADDTPNAILQRLLGIPTLQPGSVRAHGSAPHPQRAFRAPILHVLTELGGRAPKREVLARLAHIVALTEADEERNIRGHGRWVGVPCRRPSSSAGGAVDPDDRRRANHVSQATAARSS